MLGRVRPACSEAADASKKTFRPVGQREERGAAFPSCGTEGGRRAAFRTIGLADRREVLLVDEPTAGLSKMLSEEVYEMLKMLVTVDELTILLVDQEIRQALKIADYVYVLELGRNKFEGPAQQFTDLEKAFWVGG